MKIPFLSFILLIISCITSYAQSMRPFNAETNKRDSTFRSNLKFEKIFWQSNKGSFHMGPNFSIMVTNSRDFKIQKLVYKGADLMEVDTLQSGNFEAALNDSIYSAFITCLKNIKLNYMVSHNPGNPPHLTDVSSGFVIIWYNNETKYFWTLDSAFPGAIQQVLQFLDNIETKIKLKKASIPNTMH